jgi:hypothetical protein
LCVLFSVNLFGNDAWLKKWILLEISLYVVVLGGIVDYCEIGYARFNVTIMSYEWKKEIV